jgi:hypothetical protein
VGVEDVVKEVGGDDITEQQGGVACANVAKVVVGVGSPPSIGCGWEGRTLSGGLGTQRRWQQPVQQQGRARWRTIRSWPLMIGNGTYSRRCQSKGRHASAPPHRRKDHAHVSHRAEGGGQHGRWMWQGCHRQSLCLVRDVIVFNLTRMASRGAARRAHSTQMCRNAALPGSGGRTLKRYLINYPVSI